MTEEIAAGLVHELPFDLVKALTETKEVACLWDNLTLDATVANTGRPAPWTVFVQQ